MENNFDGIILTINGYDLELQQSVINWLILCALFVSLPPLPSLILVSSLSLDLSLPSNRSLSSFTSYVFFILMKGVLIEK